MSITTSMKNFFKYDKSLATVETAQGVQTLPKIFFPLLLEMLLLNLMGTINTLMLSSYSDDAVAAVGTASQLVSMILTFYSVVNSGTSVVINHNLGAGKKKEASDAAFSAIIFCGILSLVLGTVLSRLSEPVLSIMHLEPHVNEYAVTYFRIVIQFSFFYAITSSISSIFRSYGKPRIAVIVSISMNAMVAFLDYLIVFRPFPIPLEGVSGIAYAYVCSQCFGLILMLIFLRVIPLGLNLREKNIRTLRVVSRILRIGIPSGVSSISYNLSQVVSTSIIALLGTAAISTKVYVSNIVYYVYVTGMTLGMTTSLMIGWMSGAREYEKAYKLNLQNLKITISMNIVFSTIIYCFAEPLLSCFTKDPEIISMGKTLMLIDILVEIGRGFNHIEEFSLKGAGDVLYPMTISMISCWTMSILFSYILGIQLGLGLAGCWIAFAMDEIFRGIAYYLRWRSKKWTAKTVSSP